MFPITSPVPHFIRELVKSPLEGDWGDGGSVVSFLPPPVLPETDTVDLTGKLMAY